MNWITKLLDFLYSFFNKRTIVLENGKYSIGKIIGSGGYSMVYLAKPLNRLIKGSANDEELGLTSKKDYNLVCKMVSTVLDEQKKAFEMEVKSHKMVAHCPNVVGLIDHGIVAFNGQRGALIYPFLSHKLAELFVAIDEKYAAKFFLDIAKGLLAFHEHQPSLAFRDLKPDNVMVNDEGNAVLVDLGSVGPAEIKVNNRNEALMFTDTFAQTITAPFRPPELFDVSSKAILDQRTDIWSLGCTYFTLLYNVFPFDGTATATASGKYNKSLFQEKYSRLNQIIENTIVVEMGGRPFIQEIITDLEKVK